MAFPSTVLPTLVQIAPGGDPAAPDTWVWQDINADVRATSNIDIEAGQADEGASVDPSKCTLVIDDRSGKYSPRNPLGQWYGLLRKNTPLRVGVSVGSDSFTRTVASGLGTSTSGSTYSGDIAWSVNGSAALLTLTSANTAARQTMNSASASDYDMTFTCWTPVAATGASLSFSGIQYVDGSNYLIYRVDFGISSGNMSARIQRVGGSGSSVLVTTDPLPITYSPGERIRIRCQRDGARVRLMVWEEAGPKPTTWTAVATESSLLTGQLGIYGWRLSGNTNSSAQFFFDDLSINAILFVGTVPEWPVRWNKANTDSTTPIVASGVLRRLQQGASPLRSPIFRQLSLYSPTGYWPMEDASDSTVAASALTGGARASGPGVTFAADDTLPGAGAVAQLNTAGTSKISGRASGSSNTPDGYAGMAYFKLSTLPASKKALLEFTGTGTVTRWVISADNLGFILDGYDSNGNLTVNQSSTYAISPLSWFAIQLETNEVGGTVNWSLIWHQVGSVLFYTFGNSYSGTADRLLSFTAYPPTDTTSVAHVWIGDNDLPFVDFTFSLVSNGYTGELASARMARLCAEENVQILVESGDSSALGPQRVDTFVNLLRSVEEADMGVLFERGAGLQYRPRGARFNTPVSMALDFNAGHIAEPPEPTDDDQQLRNDWTVTRDRGSSARYVDQNHVDKYGRYDEATTVNIASDTELPHQAEWRVHLGTYDDLRWPRVNLNLARNPSLIPGWTKILVGSRITIANPPNQVAGIDVDLLVLGWRQSLNLYGWRIELNCAPAGPWQVGVVGTDRVETPGSALVSGVSAGATSLSVSTTAGKVWTTNPAHFPFDIVVAGERMTVTNITGASSPQTFAVTRAVNGVNKAQLADAAVNVYRPIRPVF